RGRREEEEERGEERERQRETERERGMERQRDRGASHHSIMNSNGDLTFSLYLSLCQTHTHTHTHTHTVSHTHNTCRIWTFVKYECFCPQLQISTTTVKTDVFKVVSLLEMMCIGCCEPIGDDMYWVL